MEIDTYSSMKAKRWMYQQPIEEVFNDIATKPITIPKKERKGRVFATNSKYGRKYEDIESFTGLMFIDLDKCKDPKHVKAFMMDIYQTFAVWHSYSGNVHALIRIPICSCVDEYKLRHKQFTKLLKKYLKDTVKYDSAGERPSQLAFESYDPDIYVNMEATEFTSIAPKPKPIPKKYSHKYYTVNTKSREQWVINWINNTISTLGSPGHTTLLKYAYSVGGWQAQGYIDDLTARQVLEGAIRINPYLNSRESSGTIDTYIKSALNSYEKGKNKPLEWIIT